MKAINIVYDDDSSIAEFKIYEYLGTVLDAAIQNNGDGEAILSCAGICQSKGQIR